MPSGECDLFDKGTKLYTWCPALMLVISCWTSVLAVIKRPNTAQDLLFVACKNVNCHVDAQKELETCWEEFSVNVQL